jgi:lysophospholipase L1-like esterase
VIYLFAGDSLTEGTYGESYVARLAATLQDGRAGLYGQAVNAGLAGDTVESLLKRIEAPLREHRPDWVIVAVGANDVWFPWLGRHSLGWRLWVESRGLFLGQRPTGDLDRFVARYRSLLEKVQDAGARALACTVSPLGENLQSPPNRQVAVLNGAIKEVAAACGAPVADVWQRAVGELAVVPRPSTYLVGEWLLTLLDHARLRSTSPDELSRRRRLHLTFDGIHLNSRGAELWAETILRSLAVAQGAAAPPRRPSLVVPAARTVIE